MLSRVVVALFAVLASLCLIHAAPVSANGTDIELAKRVTHTGRVSDHLYASILSFSILRALGSTRV
jgi:hypothetical protein